jgi:Ion channel
MDGTNGIEDPLLDNDHSQDFINKKAQINQSFSSENGPQSLSESLSENLSDQTSNFKGNDDTTKIIIEDDLNHISLSKELFDQWRLYRLLYSVIAVLAIGPAMIDYEQRFSADRKGDTCKQVEGVGIKWRIFSMLLSFAAIFFMVAYRISYFEWKRHHPKTFKELPPMIKYHLIEYLNLRKPFTAAQYLGDEVPVTVFLLLIFPYPGIDFTFTIPQQIKYQEIRICYYFSEILYSIMFLRFYLLVTGIFNYGKYFNPIAVRIGEKYNIKVTSNYAIKCYVNKKPLNMLLFLFLIPAVFVFGLIMRIFERPLMEPDMDFDYVGNAWWNIIITMTTVGYGDTYPSTNLGRVIVALSAFWGGIILSLTFSTMSSFLQLKTNEQKALNSIIISSVACDAISSVMSTRKKENSGKNLWGKIRERLIVLKEYRLELTNQDQLSESTENISIKLASLEKKTEKIKLLLEELHKKVDSKLSID